MLAIKKRGLKLLILLIFLTLALAHILSNPGVERVIVDRVHRASNLYAGAKEGLAKLLSATGLDIPRHIQTNSPILGGFSIDTPEKATRAAADNVQVVFQYGQPPSESDPLGQRLQSLHMKVVDGYIWSLLYDYECHRTKTVKPPPSGYEQYCQVDKYSDLTDENVLLTRVAAHRLLGA